MTIEGLLLMAASLWLAAVLFAVSLATMIALMIWIGGVFFGRGDK